MGFMLFWKHVQIKETVIVDTEEIAKPLGLCIHLFSCITVYFWIHIQAAVKLNIKKASTI